MYMVYIFSRTTDKYQHLDISILTILYKQILQYISYVNADHNSLEYNFCIASIPNTTTAGLSASEQLCISLCISG